MKKIKKLMVEPSIFSLFSIIFFNNFFSINFFFSLQNFFFQFCFMQLVRKPVRATRSCNSILQLVRAIFHATFCATFCATRSCNSSVQLFLFKFSSNFIPFLANMSNFFLHLFTTSLHFFQISHHFYSCNSFMQLVRATFHINSFHFF